MKKTIFATLALGAAITFGGVSSNEASADEIDYNKLAEQAKTNAPEINNEPIQEGNYDFSFSDGEFTYHFYNYNGNFGYEYQYGSTQVNNTSSQLAAQEQTGEQKVDQQQAQFDVQNEIDTNKATSSNEQPKQVEAPKKEVKQETATKSTASNGSIESQILAAGGDQAMVEIAKRESTLNPNAVNASSGATGLFQGLGKDWANGSVAEQTKGAKQYMIDRYGSTSGALSFHDANNHY
ncbi:putative transglycosylase [Staphylococcus phage vB_SauM_JDF86]|nr:putative transglycosylase [Staphylococcus phage vB_SauM_JDF86]